MSSTPLVGNAQEEVPARNVEGTSIESLKLEIVEFLGSDQMMDVFDEAVSEVYTLEERELLGEDDLYGRVMHTALGRALLAAAEEQFIQASGVVD